MKKFQSFDDIENYLKNERLPYTDNKDKILDKINNNIKYKKFTYKKVVLICAIALISITTVAFAFGFIPEHDEFVKAHNGKINYTLTDDNGDIVIQLGEVDDVENDSKRQDEMIQREKVAKEFEDISNELENKLSNDKMALFIPVKGIDSFIEYDLLNYDISNWIETYYTIEDIKNYIPKHSPLPKYIPKGFTFNKSDLVYFYEDANEINSREFLNKLFEEAKASGKDYYYKEYKRSSQSHSFYVEYKQTNSDKDTKIHFEPRLNMRFKKGKTTRISEFSSGVEKKAKTIEHNGKKYLVESYTRDDGTRMEDYRYYTYVYINDELWTIEISKSKTIAVDEIFKIVESME